MGETVQHEVRRSEPVYAGKHIRVREDHVFLSTGDSAVQEMVDTPEIVLIVPLLSEREVVMVRQFRHCVREHVLEFPAGKMESGESAVSCARRELAEETGYTAKSLALLGVTYAAPEFSNERVHIFLGQDLFRSAPHPEPHEFLEIIHVDVPELEKALRQHTIVDAKSALAAYMLFDFLHGELLPVTP